MTKKKKGASMADGNNDKGGSVPKVLGLIFVLALGLLATFSNQTITLLQEQLKNTREDLRETREELNKLVVVKERIADLDARFLTIDTRFTGQKEYATLRLDEHKNLIDDLCHELRTHIKEHEKANAIVTEKVKNLERSIFNKQTQ